MPYFNPNISYFAKTNFHNEGKLFGIFQKDRLMHTYILGKTGTGKTNLLTTLILQDMIHNRGCAVFDVHGDLIEQIKAHAPTHRIRDIIVIDPSNPLSQIRYNPLKKVGEEKKSLVVGGILDAFSKLWKASWGAKLEHILRYIILTLILQPKAHLGDITNIIHSSAFRDSCISRINNADILRFWQYEFPKYTKQDLIPILNKVGAFLAHPSVKRFFIENPKDISLRHLMDTQKIILIDISKGKIGSDAAHLVGSILISSFANASFTRINEQRDLRVPFHIYLDEFHNYTSESIIGMLSELRKFKVSLNLAHQYLYQLSTDIRNAVLGNVGTIISFRTGQQDAQYLAKEMYPVFESSDFTSLENFDIYLKLMINGKPSKAFSATTISFKEVISFHGGVRGD